VQLNNYQERWRKKPVLRLIYADLYKKIESYALPGLALEIGGGIGNLQISNVKIIKSDIQHYHGINVVADAHNLPFNDKVFENIILFDVLHHLQCPLIFFKEAERVLKPEGRIIMIEPGITPVSKWLYKMGHEEPVDMGWNMSDPCCVDKDKDPYESNQAIPTILFKRDVELFLDKNRYLSIVVSSWLSLFAYPLSGGFKSWSLMPCIFVDLILKIEEKLLPFLGRFMSFRIMVVLEKNK